MEMVEHKVLVRGRAVRGNGLVPRAGGAILSRLDTGLHGAVDVAFRRSSSAGRRQKWLRLAGEVEFVDAERLADEEMALYFEAPRFGDVAEEYYSQPRLFDDGPSKDETAFDALGGAVNDVLTRKSDSDRYDLGLLQRFCKFEANVFSKDVSEIVISASRTGAPATHISEELPQRAKELYLTTPEPLRTRVAGKLDMIEASTLAFALVLPGGERVRGVWRDDDFETLRVLVNSDVVATGIAIYRPSGSLLRIDAEQLAPQRSADRFFATLPVPGGGKLDLKSLLREQRKRGGMAAIWGRVPAEESDEDFLAAVRDMD